MSRLSIRVCAVALAAAPIALPATARADDVETILFIRHGEKPAAGLGQLSCKGLNRALALPGVIEGRFGTVAAVFAPDPARQKEDGGASYDYVRPLATAEPTAIRFALPIHADIGFSETDKLLAALNEPTFANARVLVVWEHHALRTLVPKLVASFGGDAGVVPKWPSEDFDSIWRVTITRETGGGTKVAFAHERENLDHQPDVCPR